MPTAYRGYAMLLSVSERLMAIVCRPSRKRCAGSQRQQQQQHILPQLQIFNIPLKKAISVDASRDVLIPMRSDLF